MDLKTKREEVKKTSFWVPVCTPEAKDMGIDKVGREEVGFRYKGREEVGFRYNGWRKGTSAAMRRYDERGRMRAWVGEREC